MPNSFSHSATFGKRIEYYKGLDVDTVIKKPDGTFVEIQIKARSKTVTFGDATLFAALKHEYRPNYWFLFYSKRIEKNLILSSKEFIKNSNQNKTGKNKGKRSIWFNGKKTKEQTEHIKPQFEKYAVVNFDRILKESPDE